MHIAHYLGLLERAQRNLAQAFREVADGHSDEPDIRILCRRLAEDCDGYADRLGPFVERYGADAPDEPDRLHSEIFSGTRQGGLGVLRDLQDLYLMAAECDVAWTVIGQAAQGLRDRDLLGVVEDCEERTATQLQWLRTRMKQAAPQALVVA